MIHFSPNLNHSQLQGGQWPIEKLHIHLLQHKYEQLTPYLSIANSISRYCGAYVENNFLTFTNECSMYLQSDLYVIFWFIL